MKDSFKIFISETINDLKKIRKDISTLRTTPENKDKIDQIQKKVHLLNVSSNLYNLPKLETASKSMEAFLQNHLVNPEKIQRSSLDYLEKFVDSIENALNFLKENNRELEIILNENSLDEESVAYIMQTEEFTSEPLEEYEMQEDLDGTPLVSTLPIESMKSNRDFEPLIRKITQLMDELVLSRNHLHKYAQSAEEPELLTISSRFDYITNSLENDLSLIKNPSALVKCLSVYIAHRRYFIPLRYIYKTIRIDMGLLDSIKEEPNSFLYQGESFSLVVKDLNFILFPEDDDASFLYKDIEYIDIVILESNGRRAGIIVDSMDEIEDALYKPMPSTLKDNDLFEGLYLLDNQEVVLIISGDALLNKFFPISGKFQFRVIPMETNKIGSYILVKALDDYDCAFNLDEVVRILNISGNLIEKYGSRSMILYKDMPIPIVDRLGNSVNLDPETNYQVAICTNQKDKFLAIPFNEIVDIIDCNPDILDSATTPSFEIENLYITAILDTKVSDIFNIQSFLDKLAK